MSLTPSQAPRPFLFSRLIADDESDIIEEALYYFKANVFFKQFEVKVRGSSCSFINNYCCCSASGVRSACDSRMLF